MPPVSLKLNEPEVDRLFALQRVGACGTFAGKRSRFAVLTFRAEQGPPGHG